MAQAHTGLGQLLRLFLLRANPWIGALIGTALILAGLAVRRYLLAPFGIVLVAAPVSARLSRWWHRRGQGED